MTVVLESTATCSGGHVARIGLAAVGLRFEHVVRPDGWFLATHGVPGPVLRLGAEPAIGVAAVLLALGGLDGSRYWPPDRSAEIERWLTLAMTEAGPAAGALRRPGSSEAERTAALATLGRVVAALDAKLAEGPWLVGPTMTVADWLWAAMPTEGPIAARLPPRVVAYVARVRAIAEPRPLAATV